jgi:hypothetical protein
MVRPQARNSDIGQRAHRFAALVLMNGHGCKAEGRGPAYRGERRTSLPVGESGAAGRNVNDYTSAGCMYHQRKAKTTRVAAAFLTGFMA